MTQFASPVMTQPGWVFKPRNPIPGFEGLGSEIRAELERPFSQGEIRHDVKRHTDGFQPTYVEASTVIQRLNDTFNSAWSFEIESEQLVPPTAPTQVIIRGRLTIVSTLGNVVKEQYGSCFLKKKGEMYIDIGSDYKAAATDCLKKCATQLGIALDLYSRDEAPMQGLTRTGDISAHGTYPQVQMDPNAPAEKFQIEAMRKTFAELGIGDAVWQQQLGLMTPGQVTCGLVQAILSGTHPYVQHLMQQSGKSVGLKATAA